MRREVGEVGEDVHHGNVAVFLVHTHTHTFPT